MRAAHPIAALQVALRRRQLTEQLTLTHAGDSGPLPWRRPQLPQQRQTWPRTSRPYLACPARTRSAIRRVRPYAAIGYRDGDRSRSPTGLLIGGPPGWDPRLVKKDQPIVLVGSRQLPQGEDDSRGLASSITGQGWPVRWASWDDADVDWFNCPLAVLRTPWDYTHRLPEFLTWADGVPRLANPAAVVRWNSDKRYLQDLETAGVPIVPTVWVHAEQGDLPSHRCTAWGGMWSSSQRWLQGGEVPSASRLGLTYPRTSTPTPGCCTPRTKSRCFSPTWRG